MYQKLIDHFNNIRKHKILFGLLALSLLACYKLFFNFYQLRKPYVQRTEAHEAMDDHNDMVLCNQQLSELKAARDAANADILQ